jgi:hypothetical protein
VVLPGANRSAVKKPYLVVCEPEIARLENSVALLMKQGYRPHGSMVIQLERDEHYYYQPMILAVAPAAAPKPPAPK